MYYNEGEGAAGTIYASVTLTKTTAGTCTLKGWPILTLSDRLGRRVEVDRRRRAVSGEWFSVPHADASQRRADDADAVDERHDDVLSGVLRRAVRNYGVRERRHRQCAVRAVAGPPFP